MKPKKSLNQKKSKSVQKKQKRSVKKSSKQKLLSIGAEAVLTLEKNKENQIIVRKHRRAKSYRIPEIDQRLRGSRTRREVKVLEKLSHTGFVPKLLFTDAEETIEIEYLDGERLSQTLETHGINALGTEIGKKIRHIHEQGIIHGDLTTSNMILYKGQIYFIDFGLSFFSQKEEDKAVDLHLLEQALESKHHIVSKKMFAAVKHAYANKVVLKRLREVELRGRNKKCS